MLFFNHIITILAMTTILSISSKQRQTLFIYDSKRNRRKYIKRMRKIRTTRRSKRCRRSRKKRTRGIRLSSQIISDPFCQIPNLYLTFRNNIFLKSDSKRFIMLLNCLTSFTSSAVRSCHVLAGYWILKKILKNLTLQANV